LPIFCCACAETARILLPGKFVTPNLKSPWAVSYSNTNFGGASAKIYTCFERETAFVTQIFQNLGAVGGGGDHFFDETPKTSKPPKGTSLADFTRFEPLCVRIRSRVLSLGDSTKKGHYKKSPICGEFPTQPNLAKIVLCVKVADVIYHTKFGDDRSREYKLTDGRILACSIVMGCRVWGENGAEL